MLFRLISVLLSSTNCSTSLSTTVSTHCKRTCILFVKNIKLYNVGKEVPPPFVGGFCDKKKDQSILIWDFRFVLQCLRAFNVSQGQLITRQPHYAKPTQNQDAETQADQSQGATHNRRPPQPPAACRSNYNRKDPQAPLLESYWHAGLCSNSALTHLIRASLCVAK